MGKCTLKNMESVVLYVSGSQTLACIRICHNSYCRLSTPWCLTQLVPGGAGEREADALRLHSTL